MTRQEQALGLPPSALTGFPRWSLTPGRALYRAHSVAHGPWWFASAHGTQDDGRFDLAEPDGTCYLAATEAAAVRERWGRNLVRRGYLMVADADRTVVSRLEVPSPHRLADTVNGRAANYGVTREIGTATPYAITQAWAAAFHAVGCQGIRYQARFSTGPRDLAFALFGRGGECSWPADPTPASGRAAAVRAGIRVIAPPRRVSTIKPAVG
jgi:hypothetical protein